MDSVLKIYLIRLFHPIHWNGSEGAELFLEWLKRIFISKQHAEREFDESGNTGRRFRHSPQSGKGVESQADGWDRGAGSHHEANLLKLDSSKADALLGWRCGWDSETIFPRTVEWYRDFYESGGVGSRDVLERICEALIHISERIPLLFPVHPRTNKNLEKFGWRDRLENANVR